MKESMRKIFDKYNRKSDIVRCPYGKSIVRKQLDSYAKAAVNLYGIISRDEFIHIFNSQNSHMTDAEEVYKLLLPIVIKKGWYCFYKGYIVHYIFFEDFEQADFLLEHQEDKPRYIPDKDEFLKYEDEYYEDNDYWDDLRNFMLSIFGYSAKTAKAYSEIKENLLFGNNLGELGPILDNYNFVFDSEKQFQDFLDILMLARNNTRLWENNGFTPNELQDFYKERNKNIINFPKMQKQKIGRNDPCPCGSGKKYKKCCAIFDDEKTAQLSPEECKLFYETWYGLMSFINEKKHLIKAKIKPEYPNAVSDVRIHKIREVLWKNPELIDEYIDATILPKEKLEILKQWRAGYKKDAFFIIEYQRDFAVAIGRDENGKDKLYGIKGISNSVAETLQHQFPVYVDTVLLPFRGKIIYDSFLGTMPIKYGDNIKSSIQDIYENSKEHGIITRLD